METSENNIIVETTKGNSQMTEETQASFGTVSDYTNNIHKSGELDLDGVNVAIVGCGGCGINIARNLKNNLKDQEDVVEGFYYFDTSVKNSRDGEKVHILASGAGAGGNRGSYVSEIQGNVSRISDEELGSPDVAIVIFATAGGSGSVIGPLMLREYARRNIKTIAVVITESVSINGARNTTNTLKTITAITEKNGIYLPTVMLINDRAQIRNEVDRAANNALIKTLALLRAKVYEVDKNDRLNWIDPMGVFNTSPGIKILGFIGPEDKPECLIVPNSRSVVDSLLILHNENEPFNKQVLPLAGTSKVGYYVNKHGTLVGVVSSDISEINAIIDLSDDKAHVAKTQTFKPIDRLRNNSDDEVII